MTSSPLCRGLCCEGLFLDDSGLPERQDDGRNDDEVADDAGHGVGEGTGDEHLHGEGGAVQAVEKPGNDAPCHASAEHGDDQCSIGMDCGRGQLFAQQGSDEAVDGQLKGHCGGGGEQRRHAERQRAHQWRNEAHDGRPGHST